MRRSDGSTEWWPRHRPSPRRRELSRATSSRWCSQTSISSLQMHRPSPPQGACAKHSRVTRNGTLSLDIACRATSTGRAIHIENSTIQMHHVEGYADLEWPIDAHAIAGIFHARASVTPKRVLRSLRTQKVLATVRQTERATPRRARSCAPIKMRNISIKTRARRGLPNMHTTAKKLAAHVIWPRTKTRPGIFLQS